MGKQFDQLEDAHIQFIREQHMFFVASAGAEGLVNVSPKGMDSLRVCDPKNIFWLNLTGSGNETAAHVLENKRMTLMWCSFGEKPLILRAYGEAELIYPRHAQWSQYYAQFPETAGARQIFNLSVTLVQTSCGFAVPHYDFVSQRDTLVKWAEKKGETAVEKYWQEKNTTSLDGKDTGILSVSD